MAKAPPSFDFYYNDWIGGTYHLPNISYACYHKLLVYQWQNGHIPLKKEQRMTLCGINDVGQWDGIWESIEDKFIAVTGSDVHGWTGDPDQIVMAQERMHEDRSEAIPRWQHRLDVNRENGKRGGRPRRKKKSESVSESVSENKPIPEGGRGKGEGGRVNKEELPYSEKFAIAWKEWRAYKGKTIKPMSYAKQLKQLAGFADEARAVAMIDHTITKGWKGLREQEAQPQLATRRAWRPSDDDK